MKFNLKPFHKPFHKIENDLLFVNKPAGFTTHASSPELPGFMEWLKHQLEIPDIFPVHRLDRPTTGALVFALTQQRAREVSELFLNKKVQKTYRLVSHLTRYDQNSSPTKWNWPDKFTVNCHISQIGKEWKVSPDNPNSTTHFTCLKRNTRFGLFEARPETGKTHQIRIHAKHFGLPLLGDSKYGDSSENFPHLCLHSSALKIPGSTEWNCPPPLFMDRLGLLRDSTLCSWISGIDRRLRLYPDLFETGQAARLLHSEESQFRLEFLGDRLWGQWYSDTPPNDLETTRLQALARMLGSLPLFLQHMPNRGHAHTKKQMELHQIEPMDPLQQTKTWTVRENDFQFELRSDQGLSHGLFLDQKNNRKWVSQNCQGLRVLNLFSYTCGFSVAAASGEAQSVVSVDASEKYLEWGKRNFELNGLALDPHRFFARDVLGFLEKAKGKGEKFDAIICDPPSFGRSKDRVFRLEKDRKELCALLRAVWSGRGWILFATNAEFWNAKAVETFLAEQFPDRKVQAVPSAWDFELPGKEPEMKSFRIF